jgi:RNA polymerase sigma factor (sigma-70 family)
VWAHLIDRNRQTLLQWDGLYDDAAWHEHSLQGFLKTVTTNVVNTLHRRAQRQLPNNWDPADILIEPGDPGDNPELDAEAMRLKVVYDSCAEHFSERDHKLINLWFEGYSAQQIAEEIGINANNVYQRKSYLFDLLRECLTDKLPEYFRHV